MLPPHLVAGLSDVDISDALDRRAPRAPDHERLTRALAALMSELRGPSPRVLERLVELARELCDAESAAVGIVEGDVVRTKAVAGLLADAPPADVARDASPAGVVLAYDAVRLMRLPHRCFPAIAMEPQIVETLLVPLHVAGELRGALWIASHSADRAFDREDARVLDLLATSASAAWHVARQNEALIEQADRNDVFLATLGHELRDPLAAIATAGTILNEQLTVDGEMRRCVEIVVRQTRHVTRLVDDLIDVQRIQREMLRLERQPLDFRALVAEAIEARRAQIEDRNRRLSIDLGAAPVPLDGDPVRLTQIVANLLDNAVKYTTDRGHVAVSLTSANGEAVLSVADDGEGIPRHRHQEIFEPFTQLNPSRTRPGLGLGLTLVRRLTELHDGTVQVTSDGAGRGSRFTLRFPLFVGPGTDPR